MAALLSLGISIGFIAAVIWSIDALSTLKQGQKQILTRLAQLELLQGQARSAALPNDALLPPARND